MEKEIVARECKFAFHIPSKHPDVPDLHLIKERVHYSDGTTAPNLVFKEDYIRNFYVTKPVYRDHQQKKESEKLSRLNEYRCTQSQMRFRLAKALDRPGSNAQIKELCTSPYVYGTDLTSTSMIKHDYKKQWPDAISEYSVAVFDLETDMLHGSELPIMGTVVFKNEVLTVVLRSFVEGFGDPIGAIDTMMDKYLSEYVVKRNIKARTLIVDTEFEIIDACFKQLHAWKPDIVAIWNMDFDIPKCMEVCKNAGVDPKWVFSDPSVPDEFKSFRYKQGQKKRVSAAGKVFPISPAAQWHVVYAPASFQVLDAMCVYKLLRLAKGEERSYSLDYILNKVLGIRKLKFKEADGYIEGKWHIFMQTYYKIEYIIYNRFDCISMQELDEKTKDLSNTMPDYAGVTDFDVFNSQPKRIATDYHYYLLDNGEVLAAKGTTAAYVEDKDPEPSDVDENGDLIDDEGDGNIDDVVVKEDRVLSVKGWIITLPSANVVDNGLRCLKEDHSLHTNARGHVYDSDCVSSYPSDIMALNVSKATTVREIIRIEGIEEYTFRMQNINIMAGHTNALEYCTTMFNFPTPSKMLELYQASR